MLIATIADALISNTRISKLSLPKYPILSSDTFRFWKSNIELHLRRNVLLQMRSDFAPFHDPISEQQKAPYSEHSTINISKIRQMLQKSEQVLYSQIVQLQNIIKISDLPKIRQKYDISVEEKIDQERKKFVTEKSMMEKRLDLTRTTLVKLEREKESTQEETRGLCGVLHVMDSQNKELKERVKELEIKLKKANRENSKLKKKQKKK